ncbi:MAG: thioredoxin family protein [Candidatus Cloacimonetes bacterium]|nr:thioredoxin family protein [Candidatus Cloacimonadota bacterium]
MKYILIMILISMVAVLGCTPAPKSDAPVAEAQNTIEPMTADAYEPGTWIENWDLAMAAAKELKRPVLVNFTGSDWCSWCIRLKDEVFSKPDFMEYAKANLVLLTLDFPRRLAQSEELKAQNQLLQRQFGIQGYPTIVLVDSEGKELNRTGYQQGGAAKYVEHLQELLTK